jgi:hypothetical protein
MAIKLWSKKQKLSNRALLFKKKEIIKSINDISPLEIIPTTIKLIEKIIIKYKKNHKYIIHLNYAISFSR